MMDRKGGRAEEVGAETQLERKVEMETGDQVTKGCREGNFIKIYIKNQAFKSLFFLNVTYSGQKTLENSKILQVCRE